MEKSAATLSDGDFDAKISAFKSELANVEERLKVIQREKDTLASESMERTYLRSRKEDLITKESNLKQMYNLTSSNADLVADLEVDLAVESSQLYGFLFLA